MRFAEMAVDAVDFLEDRQLPIEMIGVKRVSGGSMTVSLSSITPSHSTICSNQPF
jgi:hypothetical protein